MIQVKQTETLPARDREQRDATDSAWATPDVGFGNELGANDLRIELVELVFVVHDVAEHVGVQGGPQLHHSFVLENGIIALAKSVVSKGNWKLSGVAA